MANLLQALATSEDHAEVKQALTRLVESVRLRVDSRVVDRLGQIWGVDLTAFNAHTDMAGVDPLGALAFLQVARAWGEHTSSGTQDELYEKVAQSLEVILLFFNLEHVRDVARAVWITGSILHQRLQKQGSGLNALVASEADKLFTQS